MAGALTRPHAMNTPLKLAGFALGLVAVFGAALGIGAAVGPVGPAAEAAGDGHDGHGAGGHEDGRPRRPAPPSCPPG